MKTRQCSFSLACHSA